jgi:tetratricopeptide (TPR) repeat protein
VIYEHRTYLPSFGFFLILTSGIYLLLWNRYKYLAISIFVILIGSDSVLTYARNTIWKDDLALWNDNVLKTPDKARPFSNRGFAYEKLGQLDQAVADFSRAIGIDPNNAKAYSYREMAIRKLQEMKK